MSTKIVPSLLLLVACAAGSMGCARGRVSIVDAAAEDPGATTLLVTTDVTNLQRHECRVEALYGGMRGEAPVDLDRGLRRQTVVSRIDTWEPTDGDGPLDHVLVQFLVRNRVIATAEFPPPWRSGRFDLPPPDDPRWPPQPVEPARAAGSRETAARDLREPDAAPPAESMGGGERRTTDVLTPAPCTTCTEPRGEVSPCPSCGID